VSSTAVTRTGRHVSETIYAHVRRGETRRGRRIQDSSSRTGSADYRLVRKSTSFRITNYKWATVSGERRRLRAGIVQRLNANSRSETALIALNTTVPICFETIRSNKMTASCALKSLRSSLYETNQSSLEPSVS